jgi:catechol 2,3-dioxygenase-like lactoylglutathione lyase family enzyme
MLRGIDHLVIAVKDLDVAIRNYSALGFTVVRGGRHPIGTHNALIALQDGSYLELIAFLTGAPPHPWYRRIERGGGLVDYCMQTDDLTADVERLRRAGVAMNEPSPLTRERPDGYRVAWVLSIPQPPFNGAMPFLIKDETPRDERVPRERAHPNGATGIRSVTVAVDDAARAARYWEEALQTRSAPCERADLGGRGARVAVGPHEVVVLAPSDSSGALARFLAANGPSPYEATLAAVAARALDESRLERARLRIG